MFVLWNQVFTDDTSKISAAFLNYVRNSVVGTIDAVGGSNGSVYTPSTVIQIGGSGLRIVSSDFYLDATSTFHGDGEIDQQGNAAFTGQTTITDCIQLDMTGPFTKTGNLATTSIRRNTAAITNTASIQNIVVTTADFFVIPSGHTNDLDIRPAVTGPVPPDNCVVRFVRELDSASSRVARLKTPGGVTIATLGQGGAGFIDLVFYSGAWHYFGSGGVVVAAVGSTLISVP